MRKAEISVVLPVHGGAVLSHLLATFASIRAQTLQPHEVVLVEDGPLPAVLRVAISEAERDLPLVRVVLPTNGGAGVANQAGLEAASGDWIAKVDVDDVHLPHRFERQYRAVRTFGVDVCGSSMLEFTDAPENVIALRKAPTTHHAIGRRLRYNSPINHPTAFYARQAALDSGGYPPWRYMQDYGLFARMFAAGHKMMNLEEPQVLFRSSDAVIRRRRDPELRKLELDLQRELHRLGIVCLPRMWGNVAWRLTLRALPSFAMHLVSRHVLARAPSLSVRTAARTGDPE